MVELASLYMLEDTLSPFCVSDVLENDSKVNSAQAN